MKDQQQYDLKVFVRLKPKQRDVKKNYVTITQMSNFKQITLKDPFHLETGDTHMFLFDNVFTEDSSQVNIYDDTCKSLYETLMKGKNAGIITYGNSKTGKTYTLFGEQNLIYERNKIDITQKTDPRGILARFAHKLFTEASNNSLEIEAKVSFYELSLEQIRDMTRELPEGLMNKRVNEEKIENSVYEKEDLLLIDKGNKCFVKGANEVIATSAEDIIEIYESGVF